jgi:hypothetical protein
MPRGNLTGPMGLGSQTGRRAGFCAGNDTPGYSNRAEGIGSGKGLGRRINFGGSRQCGGFGRRNRFFTRGLASRSGLNSDPEVEKSALKSQFEFLQTKMDAIKQRLEELTAEEQQK